MIKIIGFLSGVVLTFAAYLLALAILDRQEPGIVAEGTPDSAPVESSELSADIVTQAEVVQAEDVSGITVPRDQESGTADAEPQNGFVEVISDNTPEEPSEVSTAIVAHADVVQTENESDEMVPPQQEPVTAADEPQNSFVEATGDVTPEQGSQAYTASVAQADVVQAAHESDKTVPPNQELVTADGELQNSFVETGRDGTPKQRPETSTTQANVVQAEHEPGITVPPDPGFVTADGQLQNGIEAAGKDQYQRSIDQTATGVSNREDTGNARTYLFWSPFRSEWSAQGFAGRLTKATKVPVEVVNTGPAKYRVAFSYQDETERLARIEHIETITGLKLE